MKILFIKINKYFIVKFLIDSLLFLIPEMNYLIHQNIIFGISFFLSSKVISLPPRLTGVQKSV